MKPAKMQNGLVDDTQLVILESDHLVVSVAPRVGGKITSLRHKPTGHEFLWRNTSLWLTPCPPGSAYDPNFYGGIDEILPGDVPERVDGVPYPDHGELWTLSLSATASGDGLHCSGLLPQRPSVRPAYVIGRGESTRVFRLCHHQHGRCRAPFSLETSRGAAYCRRRRHSMSGA